MLEPRGVAPQAPQDQEAKPSFYQARRLPVPILLLVSRFTPGDFATREAVLVSQSTDETWGRVTKIRTLNS